MASWNSGPVQIDSWGTGMGSHEIAGFHESPAQRGPDQFATTNYGNNFNDFQQHNDGFHDEVNNNDEAANNDKCFGCGEPGHRRAECPNAEAMTCRFCHQPGHMVKDCPEKPPMVCGNCGEDGHMKKDCQNARKIDRSHFADVTPEAALAKIRQAAAEREAEDAKEGIQEYIKACDGNVTYKDLQEMFIHENINLWLVATERSLIDIFTNMDLQGNTGKKFTVSYRFSEKPERPREVDMWPQGREELLNRLDDAGEPVDCGKPKCANCDELGHIAKHCTQEKIERTSKVTTCYNCGGENHRVRDCPEPRVDRFACKNCGKSGHKASECEEEPNLDNVECRKCQQKGHFAKDCPQAGSRACRNCGQEGHFASDCDQPTNLGNVTCRNCEKTGHFRRDCPEPTDWSKVQCSTCGEFGHTKVRCKKMPTDNMDNDFGGGNEDSGEDAGWSNEFAAAAAATGPALSSGGW